MNTFEDLWNEDNNNNNNSSLSSLQKIEETKEYQIRDGLARYRLMSDIFQKYFFQEHGEKIITEIFKKVEPVDIEFHLN